MEWSLTLALSDVAFSPVIKLPSTYEVFDLSQSYDPFRTVSSAYGIGKYNEHRKGVYTTPLFTNSDPSEVRDIHVGIDISCPIGEPVHAFYEGSLFLAGINPTAGDYGGTIITKHTINGVRLWALYGHLSHASVAAAEVGAKLSAGQVIGWVGDHHENGGWNPHLHFQLSLVQPKKADLPGVVARKNLEWALKTFPDPQLVLGKLY